MDEVTVLVNAPRESVWRLVTDVTRYGEWSPENQGGRWSGEPGLGAVFKGTNKHGVMRWTTKCTVIEYEQPSNFAFEVAESRMRWGYRLEEVDGKTKVTEWRDHVGEPPFPIRMIVALGLLGKPREQLLVNGMRKTLERVKQVAERDHARQ
jgi:uncharacterized protein YndB with AHSA1/START domain